MNEGSIVYLKTGNNASVNVAAEGKVVVKVNRPRKVSPPAEGAITPGQWAEMKAAVKEWGAVAELAGCPLDWRSVYPMVYAQAKSAGREGVTCWRDFPACDFERAMKFIRQKIGKLRKTNRFIENDPEAFRKAMLAKIHKKVKERAIPESRYREYLLAQYGVNSSGMLDIGQLQVFSEYIQNGGMCILSKPKEKTVFELREESLRLLMQERGGVVFGGVNEAQVELVNRDPGLFSGLGLDAFQIFWKTQKVTKLKRGRKSSSLEAPAA